MGTVTHFLGIKFMWKRIEDGNLDVHMGKYAFDENLVHMAGLGHDKTSAKATPLLNGHYIGSVNHIHLPSAEKATLTTQMCSLEGSLLGVSQGKRGVLVLLPLY